MSDRYDKGLKVMREHLGELADQHLNKIRRISRTFERVNVEFPFADLYGDDQSQLDQKTRELCTISALTVLGYAELELKLHVEGALNCGATKEEVADVITQMLAYCGFPAATNALFLAGEVFEARELIDK